MDASNPYHKQIQSLPLSQLSKEMLVISWITVTGIE